jgi:hypothetical protein
VTQNDDPVVMRGLIDNAAVQGHQVTLLWEAIEQLSKTHRADNCSAAGRARHETFDSDKFSALIGK